MATVHLAVRKADGRLLAVKQAISPADRCDPYGVLAREAHLSSRVHHPNVVSIVDVDLAGQSLLLIMDYVEGTTLGALAAEGPLPPRLVARIVYDACGGLAAVHKACDQRGFPLEMVHRDVSPDNVLVGVDGVSRLTDFGVAIARGTPRSTGRTSRKGKPGYMAPEYLQDGRSTPATDLYALAVVAWEALTGRPLFADADTLEQVALLHRKNVPPPSAFSTCVSPGWDAFLLRALGHGPASRFGDAESFGVALAMACAGDMASPREVGEAVERSAAEILRERRQLVHACLHGSGIVPAVREPLRTVPEAPIPKRRAR